ncbi:hypothetical protein D9Q98_000436 [Chlorella vulgaris]|uniref:ARID domain-containing protein n=1 Tax=Chlorella vulgaris TaxID=3077 RepID=A0A9D4Z156_CHLVU|nr:hypothetical protein D9Q98_000436 [Chlorella vulgaris]
MGGPAKADNAPLSGRGAAGGSVGTALAALATKEQFAEVPAGLISSSLADAESAPRLTLPLPPPCRQVWTPFMASRHLDASPALFNRAPLDLHKLFKAVMRAGGYETVLAQKGWARVGRTFNPPPSMTDLSYQIKKIYASKLLDFEKASVAASGV